MFLTLASKSLVNRKGSVLLTILAMSVSIFVLLGVEHVRYQAKESFSNTVSGVDLIVGARTGSLNLLLYSVFRIGAPTNNISWNTFKNIQKKSDAAWVIPISLGDSHKGYRVLGTTKEYFTHFSYGKQHRLTMQQGVAFDQVFDVVLGAEVAAKLGYQLGDKIVLAHGMAATSFSLHEDKPFQVVGILSPTGTPVDQTLHVSLQGIEAIHVDWKEGVHSANSDKPMTLDEMNNLTPKSITAFMLGLKSKMKVFQTQRMINEFQQEPLIAILPGITLSELWQMIGMLENTLRLISALVLLAALLGLSAMLLASIRERSHEIHLLRVIGAPPRFLFFLIEIEALLISLLSIGVGMSILYSSLLVFDGYLTTQFGLYIDINFLTKSNLLLIAIIVLSALIAAAIPSFKIYNRAKSSV